MLSQYANSPKYVALYNGLTELFNNAKTIEDWYNVVFNIKTASGFGLDVWGNILNQGRLFLYEDLNGNPASIYLQGAQTVDGVAYTAQQTEELYRTVLFLTAMGYITNASLRSMNDMLLYYFADKGRCYCIPYGTMKLRVVFEFYVNGLEKAIYNTAFVSPTGVLLNYEYLQLQRYFGFFVTGIQQEDQPYLGSNQGPFYK